MRGESIWIAHIIVQVLEKKDIKKILEVSRKKRKIRGDSLAEMIQARRQQNDIFKVLKDICHSKISFPPQISFNYEVKRKKKERKYRKNKENIEIQRKNIEK